MHAFSFFELSQSQQHGLRLVFLYVNTTVGSHRLNVDTAIGQCFHNLANPNKEHNHPPNENGNNSMVPFSGNPENPGGPPAASSENLRYPGRPPLMVPAFIFLVLLSGTTNRALVQVAGQGGGGGLFWSTQPQLVSKLKQHSCFLS